MLYRADAVRYCVVSDHVRVESILRIFYMPNAPQIVHILIMGVIVVCVPTGLAGIALKSFAVPARGLIIHRKRQIPVHPSSIYLTLTRLLQTISLLARRCSKCGDVWL
ncbi:hypothetical protein GUITHDRAFT_117054 [Guillardia theta CCMP2712]|uniref:Uncharacterized protein n=1 Tax=Guillardia theta (strain CCMP2712) TaxID=905079 RepID=L1IKI7_GUITC|nr:hypothetical protein GUITHDRAFT_117054 [Guillardia theta CCMP2712]EKX36756.1 hypothetical protein GUITHDRAFT_117054 [Guillardia theta CCMP2712]|eukprot:XP_005823736.1 hypothetical protein GUITHDRAFT_117054 [Guillardia theta CCMP2712]